MTRLTSFVAIAVAALALAAPALADVKASHPGDVGRPADAFARDYFRDAFRAHPGTSSWNVLRPLASTWN